MCVLMLKLLFICLFAFPAFAQTDLPIFGKLSEIEGKSTFYVVAEDAADRRQIENVLSERLVKVIDPAKADLFVEYKSISRTTKFFGGTERGAMTLYYVRGDKRVIVWSDAVTGGAYKSDAARRLARKLRSALKKNS